MIEWAIGIVIAAILALVAWAAWEDAHAEHISIRKDEWACTERHVEAQLAGKVIVNRVVCDNYRRVR